MADQNHQDAQKDSEPNGVTVDYASRMAAGKRPRLLSVALWAALGIVLTLLAVIGVNVAFMQLPYFH